MATTRCKRCGRPLCNDCKIITDVGVVCSQQCLDAIKAFQERVKDDVPYRSRRRLLSKGTVKGLLAAIVLFAAAYGILCWQEGRVLTPADLRDQFDYFVRFLSTYF